MGLSNWRVRLSNEALEGGVSHLVPMATHVLVETLLKRGGETDL